jgi:anti-sigma regulatory factor (Ser/Thr protein kinase)
MRSDLADQPIAGITLAAKSDYLPSALGCVRELSARLGLTAPAVEALVAAVEQVATHVILHGFDPGEAGSFDVVIRRRPGAVVISVEDRALPFDFRSLADSTSSMLGPLAEKGLIDSVHFTNLGAAGNQVEIVKRVPSKVADQTDATLQQTIAAPAAPLDVPLVLRLMTPDDAEAVTRAGYRASRASARRRRTRSSGETWNCCWACRRHPHQRLLLPGEPLRGGKGPVNGLSSPRGREGHRDVRGTVRTGQGAVATTRPATLPNRAFAQAHPAFRVHRASSRSRNRRPGRSSGASWCRWRRSANGEQPRVGIAWPTRASPRGQLSEPSLV